MTEINEIVTLFANFINYLNVSYYEYHFTQTHQQARLNLDVLLCEVSKTPEKSPTLEQCISFYNDVRSLKNVTETNDPDYHNYKRLLRTHIAMLSTSSTPE
jgi:hypothetical protein